ncbi:TonB family protein [Oleiharenicola lentus]|uniref:TonB family protein n=1 Tax=Oleiharenicola lentus TaxID=2508720 RepID=A0A4Q1C7L5_9BACT|nr:TonB family protein [Oleiharenicola lentus]RXK54742.1 TonB family protein [Oleiharenicola lentus]
MSPLNFRATLFRRVRQAAAGSGIFLTLLATAAAAATEAAEASAGSANRQSPVVLRRVTLDFPPELKKELVQGSVMLECLVDTEGKARQIHVAEATHPAFARVAVESLELWEFAPGTINGQPAPMRIRVPFEFQLSSQEILETVAGRPVFMEVRETVIPASQLPNWPRPKNFYIPRYPPELEGSGKYGKAVVNITIDKEGRVINPRLVKATYPEFVAPALITALKLEFPPQVMANREAIHVNLDIQFDFKVPDKDQRAADKAKAKAKAEKAKQK